MIDLVTWYMTDCQTKSHFHQEHGIVHLLHFFKSICSLRLKKLARLINNKNPKATVIPEFHWVFTVRTTIRSFSSYKHWYLLKKKNGWFWLKILTLSISIFLSYIYVGTQSSLPTLMPFHSTGGCLRLQTGCFQEPFFLFHFVFCLWKFPADSMSPFSEIKLWCKVRLKDFKGPREAKMVWQE